MTKEEGKQQVKDLVRKFERMPNHLKKTYNEEQTKKNLILLLFEALGWDVRSDEVQAEEKVSGGRVDYAFKLGGITKFYLEAKPIRADLDKREYKEQLINYAYNRDVPWGILTNFKELRVFNALEEVPSPIQFNFKDYLDDFDRLWLISKEGFESGEINKWAEKWGIKSVPVPPVGERLAKDLTEWRDTLTDYINRWSKAVYRRPLRREEIDEAVQKFLDRLIFIRVAEDRGLEEKVLLPLHHKKDKVDLIAELNKLFRDFREKYDSTLFDKHFSEDLNLEGIVGNIANIIKRMHVTKDEKRYDFNLIDADVLGAVYEQYLGTIQRKGAGAKRKEQGIYYTPKFIVNYIVGNTLGKLLYEENLPVGEVKELKILDPACGSGSFLIKAFEVLDEFYGKAKAPESERRKHILTKNLYGVDLDPKAIEVAQLNLMLSAAKKRELLPELYENLKVGNSLISGKEKELKKYFGKEWREKKPFDWEEEFSGIIGSGGFDIIVGNPPWVESKKFSEEDKKFYTEFYSTAVGQYDLFTLFIERVSSLLKEGGILGFIVPDRFITNLDYTPFRKFLLGHVSIKEIVAVGEGVFEGVQMPSAILVLQKNSKHAGRDDTKVLVGQELFGSRRELLQKEFRENENYIFSIFGDTDLLSRIRGNTVPFGELVDNARGVELGKKSKLISSKKRPSCTKFLLGEDIDRYSIRAQHYLRLGDPDTDYKDPKLYQGEKILIRKTGSGIRAVLDKDSYVIQVIYIFKPRVGMGYDTKYLLALLNSSLMGFYYWSTFGERGRKTFPHLTQGKVLQLPIKEIDFSNPVERSKHDEIAKLADKILNLNKQLQVVAEGGNKWHRLESEIEKTDEQIDQMVYKLYNLTPKEIKIVEESLK